MTKQELKKGVRVWCWWGCRDLWFTGRVIRGEYEFEDVVGAVTMVKENKLTELKVMEEGQHGGKPSKQITEYCFTELGYFTEGDCEAIQAALQGRSYMHFIISWGNCAGNCTLIVKSEYETSETELKNFFLHCALTKMAELKKLASR